MNGTLIQNLTVSPLHFLDRKSVDQHILMALSVTFVLQELIVEYLARRYDKSQVYTYIGDILLAVNPFTPLPIYSEEVSHIINTQ